MVSSTEKPTINKYVFRNLSLFNFFLNVNNLTVIENHQQFVQCILTLQIDFDGR